MAILHIENLPDELYRKLNERARRGRRSIAQEVTRILDEVLSPREPLSILELEGLGKEVWEGSGRGRPRR